MAQSLDDGLIGHPKLLPATAVEHGRPAGVGFQGRLGDETRLADTGLPGYQHHLAFACFSRLGGFGQRPALLLTAHEAPPPLGLEVYREGNLACLA